MVQEGMKRSTIALCCVSIACISLGAAIGLILHFKLPKDEVMEPGPRFDTVGDCIPQGNASHSLCKRRGCTWREPTDGAPWCTFPQGYGYVVEGDIIETDRGYDVNLLMAPREGEALYSLDLERIVLNVEFHTDQRLRLRFADREGSRYEVPREAVDIETPDEAADNATRLYDVQFQTEPHFGVMVIRKSTGTVIFNTTVPGFTFSEQYLQLTSRLASPHVYGLGEHNHKQFKHDMDFRRWAIFSRDNAPVDDWNLYGAQTLYMNLEEDGNANAVLLLNSNAMDVVLQPNPHPAITYHVIGGILDFYIFLGPTPENVVVQYTEATGRPIMPPYWSLGFALGHRDYGNLTHVRTVLDRTREAGIPMDALYGDIDTRESNLAFTYDRVKYNGLPQFIDELHARGQKYMIILDHSIGTNQTVNGSYPPYQEGVTANIFIQDPRDPSRHLKGNLWPGEIVFPDFSNNATAIAWWQNQCQDFYTNKDIKYDGLWINMNEPSNFVNGSTAGCLNNTFNHPPYIPNIVGGLMYDKTICMDASQAWGLHYDVHNMYGHSMSITTWETLRNQLPDKRPLLLTRSNFVGTQKYAAHWFGDNQSLWEQIHWSVIGMLEYSLFGFSYTGADICGYKYAATEEMCIRWTQVGAFYPFARNHNDRTYPDQDPVALGQTMVRIAKDILMTRYKFLPFLYTLLHESHIYGHTVVRPMLHEFVSDRSTWSVDGQFLWGPSLLITPVMTQGATYVECYFPKARWYDYYGGLEMQTTGIRKNLTTPLDQINLHVRGGYIIPWQEPANTTAVSRQNPMGMIVALGDAPTYTAYGFLFWDDGESFETYENGDYLSLEFTTSNFKLDLVVVHNNYPTSLEFATIDIWGLPREPSAIYVNGPTLSTEQWAFNPFTKALQLTGLNLAINNNHTIEWELTG